MKLMLIRHAEAEHNTRPMIVAGRAMESPLTEIGLVQADSLARELAKIKIDILVSSPAKRCLQTAEAIKRQQKDQPKIIQDQRVLEMSQGAAVGMYKFMVVLNPFNWVRLISRGKDFAFLDGESFNTVADRMEAALDDYQQKDKTVVVVTHGLAMRSWMARKYGWSVYKLLFSRIKNTQVVEWL